MQAFKAYLHFKGVKMLKMSQNVFAIYFELFIM